MGYIMRMKKEQSEKGLLFLAKRFREIVCLGDGAPWEAGNLINSEGKGEGFGQKAADTVKKVYSWVGDFTAPVTSGSEGRTALEESGEAGGRRENFSHTYSQNREIV